MWNKAVKREQILVKECSRHADVRISGSSLYHVYGFCNEFEKMELRIVIFYTMITLSCDWLLMNKALWLVWWVKSYIRERHCSIRKTTMCAYTENCFSFCLVLKYCCLVCGRTLLTAGLVLMINLELSHYEWMRTSKKWYSFLLLHNYQWDERMKQRNTITSFNTIALSWYRHKEGLVHELYIIWLF